MLNCLVLDLLIWSLWIGLIVDLGDRENRRHGKSGAFLYEHLPIEAFEMFFGGLYIGDV